MRVSRIIPLGVGSGRGHDEGRGLWSYPVTGMSSRVASYAAQVCLILGKAAALEACLGDVDGALASLEAARKIAVAQDMAWMMGLVYCSYTELLVQHGEEEKALTYAQETLRLAKDQDDVVLVMKAARLLAALYKGRGLEMEAHQARGTELEAAAEAAALLKDLDAIMATHAALEEWKVHESKMPASPLTASSSGAAQPHASLDMHDTPHRAHLSAPIQVRKDDVGVERPRVASMRPSGLPQPSSHSAGLRNPGAGTSMPGNLR